MIGALQELDSTSLIVGALVTAIIAAIASWVAHRWDLRTKKKVIEVDLSHQMDVILRLEKESKELYSRFEKDHVGRFNSDMFEDLYSDIYESMTKSDLYKIYKSNLPALVNVYKKIEFLKVMSIHRIYSDYVDKWEVHRVSEEHKKDHFGRNDHCNTYKGFVEMAMGQLNNNLETIRELKQEINSTLKKRFYWLNPFNLF